MIGIARETFREISKAQTTTLAAAMTYHTILALFPFLLLLAGLTSIVDTVFDVPDLTQKIVGQAAKAMPDDAVSVLEGFVNDVVQGQGGGAIFFGLVGSLWAASSAVSTAIKAMNSTYDVKEDRGFIKGKLVALGLTVVFSVLLLGATALAGLGGIMAGGIGDWLGWDPGFVTLWNWLTPVLSIAMVMAAVIILYKWAPHTNLTMRSVIPGAVLFLVVWLVFSVGFAFYISNFGSYNRVYGSLAAVIILLIWMYWSNLFLLVGAELNSVIARRHDPAYRADPRTETPRPEAA